MFRDPRLLKHPGGLISLISLFLGGYIMIIDFDEKICEYELEKYLAYSIQPVVRVFNPGVHFSMLRYVAYCFMQVSQVVLQELFYSFFMYLCVCFAYDLHLTIKNPLYPTHKRRKMYTTIQIVIFIWVVFISYGSFADFDDLNAFHHFYTFLFRTLAIIQLFYLLVTYDFIHLSDFKSQLFELDKLFFYLCTFFFAHLGLVKYLTQIVLYRVRGKLCLTFVEHLLQITGALKCFHLAFNGFHRRIVLKFI